MTVDLRALVLVAVLVLAGCMPAKKAQGPVQAVPNVGVATQDSGPAGVPSSTTAPGTEVASQDEDIDPTDVLQGRENLPEAEALSAEEKRILDMDISFPVGLDTDENEDVQRYFHYYTHVHRGTMEGWLKRAQLYLPHIRKRFLEEGLPEDLIYLPFAESGFNTFALSKAGASGVWQFMPQTGINYGLAVDAWVDERRDPYKSTEAAIKYLKKLYDIFGDWPLALAAYNAGEGAIDRAMKKTGCEDYVSLCRTSAVLKEETKLYVPKFLALVKIARNLEKLGFAPIDWSKRPAVPAKLQVKPGTDLLGLAHSMGLDWKAFRELNPVFRKQEAPSDRLAQVAVPGHLVAKAEEYLKRPVVPRKTELAMYRIKPGDTWWKVAQKYGVSPKALQEANKSTGASRLQVGKSLRIPGNAKEVGPADVAQTRKWASKRANYIVRQGDTVWSLARKFNTDAASLLKANGLNSGETVKVGQKLFVPDAGSVEIRETKAKADAVRQERVSYQVQAGDTLWNIAKRFGVSPGEIRKWNNLAENDSIRPGDRLKVLIR